MSVHIISGVLAKDAVVKKSSSSDSGYLELYIQDRTRYNQESNPVNTYRVIKYAPADELDEDAGKLKAGTPVFLSGTGLFNSRKHYNIITHSIEIQEHLSVEVVEKQEEQMGYYEKLLYEEE